MKVKVAVYTCLYGNGEKKLHIKRIDEANSTLCNEPTYTVDEIVICVAGQHAIRVRTKAKK